MRVLLISLLLLYPFVKVFASYDLNENCREAYTHIINLDFEKGQALINKEKSANPNNDISLYLENYIDFLTIVIGEDEAEFEKRKRNKSRRLDVLEDGDKNSPYYRFILAEVNLQWAFSRLRFGEYLTAAREINKAYKLLEENQEEFPDFTLNNKGLGLLHVLIGTIPDNYKWAVNIFGIDGSINVGVNELTTLLRQTTQKEDLAHLQPELVFLLTFIELNFVKDDEEIEKLYQLMEQGESNSALVIFSKASVLMRTNRNDEAIKELRRYVDTDKGFHFYYLDFLLGEAKLRRLDGDSHLHMIGYLKRFKGNSYKKSAYQKLAWHYLLKGDEQSYHANISRAITMGTDVLDEDKQAQKEAESKKAPNVTLLKARLLFDGGYYQKALDILQAPNVSQQLKTEEEKVELTYRLGRIYHKQGQLDKAIASYEKTIEQGAELRAYFAANASLQLGLIYEQKKNYEKATYYFKRCSNFKNEEYRNSINQKAKAELARLKR